MAWYNDFESVSEAIIELQSEIKSLNNELAELRNDSSGLHKHGVIKRYFWIDTEGKPSKTWDEDTHKKALTYEDIKYAENMGWKLMEIEVTI